MNPKLIILVENDLNLRQSIALILLRAGYFVTSTDCGFKAMNIIQAGNFHLLIADINNPDTREILMPKVHVMYPDLSIVILTDQASSEIEKEGKLLSAHYLIKPIAPERLLDCVGTIMGNQNNAEKQT